MIRYRQVARADYLEVVQYSKTKYPLEIAEAYLEDLLAGVKMLERFPHFGHPVVEREDVRRFRRGRHFMDHKIDRFTDDLIVLAIVHERQIPPSQILE